MSELIKMLRGYKNSKIALYGLSKETENIIKMIADEVEIVGLLDGYQESGELYGKRIISLSEAIKENVKAVIVVARPASARIIVNRIGKICRNNNIYLYDGQGSELNCTIEHKFDLQGVNGITFDELIKKMKDKDVISFDVFDTLVTRRTLFSTDIFEILEVKLRDKGLHIKDFSKKRLFCEQKLSQNGVPTLCEIYKCIRDEYGHAEIIPEELEEFEWKTEYEYLVPRYDVVELFNRMKKLGKEVYLVSDTYYSKGILKKMLECLNVTGYQELIVSCEYRVNKKEGLFNVLKERIGSKSCIHIGDDIVSDITSAEKYELNTCHIYNKTELFEKIGCLGLIKEDMSISDRIKLGIFASHIFNSPFQFENNGRIVIGNGYDLGYLIIAPLVTEFVFWINEQTKKDNIDNIWFAARDGYVLKKMYNLLRDNLESRYFLTSRICAMRASIKNEKDIDEVVEKGFNGLYTDMLFSRFGVNSKEDIIIKANQNHKAYMDYIDTISKKDDRVAFIDLVSTGTSQMYINRIADRVIKGYYFLKHYDESGEKRALDIKGFYNDANDECQIDKFYFVLESVLTSFEPTLLEVDLNGNPVYAKEHRTIQELEYIEEVQNGIMDYFEQYIKLCPENIHVENKKLGGDIFKLIQRISVEGDAFRRLCLEDNFFNRVTFMEEML